MRWQRSASMSSAVTCHVGKLQQMRRFATWRGTGIEHLQAAPARAGPTTTVARPIARRCPAPTPAPRQNPGSAAPRWRAATPHPPAPRAGRQARCFELFEVVGHADAPGIDAQHHRRLGIVGRQNGLPLRRPLGLHLGQPPGGVVPARHRILRGLRQQRRLLTQKTAQAGIDKTGLRLEFWRFLGGFHRLIDQGKSVVGRVVLLRQQRQRGAQQGVHRRRRACAAPAPAQRLGPAQMSAAPQS